MNRGENLAALPRHHAPRRREPLVAHDPRTQRLSGDALRDVAFAQPSAGSRIATTRGAGAPTRAAAIIRRACSAGVICGTMPATESNVCVPS